MEGESRLKEKEVLNRVKELKHLLEQHNLLEISLEEKDYEIILKTAQPVQMPAYSEQVVLKSEESPQKETSQETEYFKVTSPLNGTFYRSPNPSSPPFVKEGSTVNPDTTLCIIEAMKIMNEIKAGVSGEIKKIVVKNGQVVKKGDALFLINED